MGNISTKTSVFQVSTHVHFSLSPCPISKFRTKYRMNHYSLNRFLIPSINNKRTIGVPLLRSLKILLCSLSSSRASPFPHSPLSSTPTFFYTPISSPPSFGLLSLCFTFLYPSYPYYHPSTPFHYPVLIPLTSPLSSIPSPTSTATTRLPSTPSSPCP